MSETAEDDYRDLLRHTLGHLFMNTDLLYNLGIEISRRVKLSNCFGLHPTSVISKFTYNSYEREFILHVLIVLSTINTSHK